MAIERSILDASARLRKNREPHLVATVVRVHGSAYRRPGARMLLTQFRWISGSMTGGHLDDDIASKGWSRTRDGEPYVVSYDARIESNANHDVRAALGLGCDAVVDVLIERAGTPGRVDPLELAEQCVRTQRRAAVVTVIRSEAPGVRTGARVAVIEDQEAFGDSVEASLRAGMIADARAALATGDSCNRTYRSELGNVDVFIEAILPPPRLFIFGAGHDVVPVIQLAKSMGWDVAVCVSEARLATRQRFSAADEILVGTPADLASRIDESDRAMTVVMSHDYATDKANLAMLIATHCTYIGVLGPRARTQRMLAELDIGLQSDTRIHAPVGLGIGAETPAEIALAIVSEVQSVLAQAPAYKLRDRVGPIHDRPMPRITEAVAAAGPVTGTVKRIAIDLPSEQLPVAS